jgi:HEXXH motif-containing protein
VDQRSKFSSAIADQTAAPWLPELTEDLVKSGWETLSAEQGYTPRNYSTSRVMENDVDAERHVLGTIIFDDFDDELTLERLPSENETVFEALGLCFSQTDDAATAYHLSELKLAFNLIAEVPSLHRTVLSLVRSIHVLKAQSDQHDVSFSDPTIPFSIFVSIPSVRETNSSIRLAEAIIHEAMHLQLTLIESFCPLISEDDKKLFSPWKNEDRRPSGVLHALYVFSVIYTALPLLNISDKQLVLRRRQEIESQILEIDSFRVTQGFTLLGQSFRDKLFTCFDN